MILQHDSFARNYMASTDTIERTTVMLPVKLRKQAQALARKNEDRSLSALLRSLLRNYVAEAQRQSARA